ncbi:V-set and immunoglobulin domain-containing protein 10-like 2 [Erpetoichthys calabaricus]|uniref:V-set and immunoglobulin domain-containing protein 10-like 2 n=1 Tax=Erpetoichthys calabaricus TaxID=27687 RepID=UPI002233E39B|nr:V-set and immunoglobulin domain-containing protein 10-like 2 [Erpetoichthys calabaricus]
MDPTDVEYKNIQMKGVQGQSVILDCGTSLPQLYIWGYTKPGTDSMKALLYNYGNGPRLQSLASSLGTVSVITGSTSLSISNLQLSAEGLYTCQALYLTETDVKMVYYYVVLLVLVPISKPTFQISHISPEEGDPLSVSCTVDAGTGPISYVWMQEPLSGNPIVVMQSNNSTINMTAVHRNLTGLHFCTAANEVNEEKSEQIRVEVIYGPDPPAINITPYTVTEQGYSAVEQRAVSMSCQAPSNPPSSYIWFYNNSQISTGQQFNITKIYRTHAGFYTCLAQNIQRNTRTTSTISLAVYYLPDGTPKCMILPSNNHSDLTLSCQWEGGYPLASLRWTTPGVKEQANGSFSNVNLSLIGHKTPNNSPFTCLASHLALTTEASCSITALLPPNEPVCLAMPTRLNEYLMLKCSWEGGKPQALLWWAVGDDQMLETPEENSKIVLLQSNSSYGGKQVVCYAKHPLVSQIKKCTLKLEAPVLITQRSSVSVYEGSDVQLTCLLKATYPSSEILWFNNQNQNTVNDPQKYLLQYESSWSNLTVRETEENSDSGEYWCTASNAVGGAQIPIFLQVKKYPTPPNVTISRILYSRQRTEVDLEWQTKGPGDLTGFLVQRQVARKSGRSSRAMSWETVASSIEPDIRGHKLSGLDPSVLYAFRIMAVNHRTTGYPSEVKTPADPPFNAYPAVIGAAVAGMILATVATMLVFQYIVRNRNNNPRLHDMIFGMPPPNMQENIQPEDELEAGQNEDGEAQATQVQVAPQQAGGSPSEGPSPSTEAAAAPPVAGDDNEPVSVTITVTANP